jgi:Carboxypeptidase regulatory-like domain
MRQLIAIALVSTLSLSTLSISAMAAGAQTASIVGIAQSAAGQTVVNATVRLRNLGTGPLAGTTTSSGTGAFGFTGLAAGNYSVEVVNADGQIIATSTAIPLAAGATITGVTVTAFAVPAAAAAAGGGAFGVRGKNKALLISTIAAAAGIVTVVGVVNDASPSE